jgi:hypothetical protein
MNKETVLTIREKFLNIYANLPLAVRNEIIIVLGGEPITWNAVFLEVSQSSEKGEVILNKLRELKII